MEGGIGRAIAATSLAVQAATVGGEGLRCMLEDHGEDGEKDGGEGEDVRGTCSVAGGGGYEYGAGALRRSEGGDESVSGSDIGGGPGGSRFGGCTAPLSGWCLREWECKTRVDGLGLWNAARCAATAWENCF